MKVIVNVIKKTQDTSRNGVFKFMEFNSNDIPEKELQEIVDEWNKMDNDPEDYYELREE